MKRKKFTDQEKIELLKNPNILKVGNSCITYKPEFKVSAIKEHIKGKSPFQIYIEAGININIIGRKTPDKNIYRWNKASKANGENVLLKDLRGTAKENKKPLTLKEAEVRIAYLEAENEFLKKLDALERGLM